MGVVAGAGRGVVGWHADAGYVVGAERVDGEGGDEGGIDAARKADQDLREAALADIVADAESEGVPGGFGIVAVFGWNDGGAGVGVEKGEVFGKGGGLGDDFAPRIEGERGAVEDEGIVAADLVAHGDKGMVLAGEGAEHFAADGSLALPEGGGGNVEDDASACVCFGPGLHQAFDGVDSVAAAGPETFVVPGVFADGDGEGLVADGDEVLGGGGFEVALLVEDVIEGEQSFLLKEALLAGFKQGGYVADGLAFSVRGDGKGGAYEQGGAASGGGGPAADLGECGFGLGEEGGFLEQVGRPVAADSELGEEDEVGSGVGGSLGKGEDLAGVALEVSDGGVDLGERDLHWSSLPVPVGEFAAVGERSQVFV